MAWDYKPQGDDQEPQEAPYALKVFGWVFLACLSGTFIALTFRLIRWIIGF